VRRFGRPAEFHAGTSDEILDTTQQRNATEVEGELVRPAPARFLETSAARLRVDVRAPLAQRRQTPRTGPDRRPGRAPAAATAATAATVIHRERLATISASAPQRQT
jgi:hypothetical protein